MAALVSFMRGVGAPGTTAAECRVISADFMVDVFAVRPRQGADAACPVACPAAVLRTPRTAVVGSPYMLYLQTFCHVCFGDSHQYTTNTGRTFLLRPNILRTAELRALHAEQHAAVFSTSRVRGRPTQQRRGRAAHEAG